MSNTASTERIQSFRFKLMPAPAQEAALEQVASSCRWVWNEAVTLQEVLREAGLPRLSFAAMSRLVTVWRRLHPWLTVGTSDAQSDVVRRLDRAYRNAFEFPERGFPQRKKRGRCREGFTDRQCIGVDVENGRVRLPKLGWFRYRNSRPVLGVVKQVRVSKRQDGWYVSLQTQRTVGASPHPRAESIVGVDLGVASFATCSDGEVFPAVNAFRVIERRLARAQRVASRRVRGSANHAKALHRVARVHARAANVRTHHLHVVSTTIAKSHGTVVLEDLNVSGMAAGGGAKKRGLNKAIHDQGWASFRQMLQYKTTWNGGRLIVVPAAYTSRTCPACGHVARENRPSQAVFLCVACGYAGHADAVASLNILAAGHAVIACGGHPEVAGPSKQEPTRGTAEGAIPSVELPRARAAGGCQEDTTHDNPTTTEKSR